MAWQINSNFWRSRKVFVTGGTGFIGTYLVNELVKNGADVYCLVLEIQKESNFIKLGLDKKVSLIYGNILDFDLIRLVLDKYDIDTAFHLAAQPLVQIAIKKPSETIRTNVIGTLNLLEACRLNNVKRVLIASSDKAYGITKTAYNEDSPIKGDHPYLKLFLTTGGPAPAGWLSLEKLLEEDIEGQFPVDYLSTLKPDPNDISTEQLSGGTTGLPKGIPRTHNDYLCQWFAFGSILGFNKDAVFLLVAPVAHNAGLIISGGVVVNGGTLIMTKSPKIEDMLRLIEKYRITHTFFVPVQITYLMEAGELRKKYDLSSLKVVGSGAQKVKPELSIWLAQELGVHPMHVFGMAEGPVICNSWLSPLEAQAHTIGTPPFDDPEDIQTKIVDPQGKEVKPGEVGEMISKGPFTFKGYFRAPEENAKAFDQEGFFYSGDLMSRRPDGRYVVEGRSKDMIIRGGENIYPEGVEQVLMEHPKVITAFCVGMPDPALGEQLCAFVQLVKGEQFTIEEMRNYMKAQGMAVYQWPERLELVEGWPLTPFQKIDKRLLRAFITAKLYQEGKIDKALGDEYLKKDKLSLEDLLTEKVKISLEGMPG